MKQEPVIVLQDTQAAKRRQLEAQQRRRTAVLKPLWNNPLLWTGPRLSELVVRSRDTEADGLYR